MKKFLILFSFLIGAFAANSQCQVTATSSVNQVVCGDCVDLNAVGSSGTAVLDNDFDNGTVGAGWSTTPGAALFTNPCDPSFDGGTYIWMGSATAGARNLTTTNFDMSCGGQVCFYLDYASQGGTGDCEGPDLPTEGVYFQYSTDGGATWTTIDYWDPLGGNDPQMTSWNQYCFTVPVGGQTTNTMFQWAQTGNSGTCCDHWGIDNVEIIANDCDYYYDWGHLAGSPDPQSGGQVCLTSNTTYDVIYTNGIDDTCTASVTVNLLLPDVTASANPTNINCGGCTTLDAVLSNLPPDSCCFTLDMDDSFGDGWNGGNLVVNVNGGTTVLGPFSANGVGSVETFCLQDGDSFELVYSSGTWEGENTYELLDPNGNPLFNDGPTPTTGSVFNSTAGCGSAPIVWEYLWSGQNVNNPNNQTTQACPNSSGWYYIDVFDQSNPTCTAIDSVFITAAQTSDTIINIDICSGSNYTFPDGTIENNITGPLTNISVIQNVNGCDSTITTNVSVSAVINTSITDNVCSGDDYTFPDGTVETNITNPVNYVINYLTAGGCDSIVTFDITPYDTYNIVEDFTICEGSDYTFTDGTTQNNITNNLSYVSNLQTINGCDSIITTNLTINPTYNLVEDFNLCEGSDYTFPDGSIQNNILNNTTHTSNLQTVNGCDSIITTNLNVSPVITIVENPQVCEGNDYTFPDGTIETNITIPMTHVSNLQTVDGCDSTIITNITLYPNYVINESVDVCPNIPITFPDGSVISFTSDGQHVSNLQTINGCDSTIVTDINVFDIPPFDIDISPNGCSPLEVFVNNNTPGSGCLWEVDGPTSNITFNNCSGFNSTFGSGEYNVTLNMLSPDGCLMDTIINNAFHSYPNPIADFTWTPPQGTITENTIYFENNSIDVDNLTWYFGDGDSTDVWVTSHTYQDSGSYPVSLIVENDYGCTDTAYGTVIINMEFYIYVPNTFTPDGDNLNDTFYPITVGADELTLYIFDRWGELVFESSDGTPWDGVYRGEWVKTDVYVWKIVVKTFEGRKLEFIGHVTALR